MAYAYAGNSPADMKTVSLLQGNNFAAPEEYLAPSITFLIRPYNGFTSRLKALAKTNSSLRDLVEGPYGMTHSLDAFDDVLFIVGGSGIAALLAYCNAVAVYLATKEYVYAHNATLLIFHKDFTISVTFITSFK